MTGLGVNYSNPICSDFMFLPSPPRPLPFYRNICQLTAVWSCSWRLLCFLCLLECSSPILARLIHALFVLGNCRHTFKFPSWTKPTLQTSRTCIVCVFLTRDPAEPTKWTSSLNDNFDNVLFHTFFTFLEEYSIFLQITIAELFTYQSELDVAQLR